MYPIKARKHKSESMFMSAYRVKYFIVDVTY